jgi:AraC family transcriptional regulator, regulatory protein of adaptative response / DNA-3-methyladenine glycosylase II
MLSDVDHGVLRRAFLAKDRRFNGRYVVGMKTTMSYCRPTCRKRLPALANCMFFRSAAQASEAGFLPCRSCRPDISKDLPAARGTLSTVVRALRLIAHGELDDGNVAGLAARLGVGERHLRRLFVRHLGVSPQAMLQIKRAYLAQKMVCETSLRITDIAHESGFRSLRRFNDEMRKRFGCAPRQLRTGAMMGIANAAPRA